MNISSVQSQNYYKSYQQLSSGKKINSAADDAAGLSIANKLQVQENGYDVGKENATHSQSMINIADGAMSSIADYLQRMKELSVRASNGLYGESDKAIFQEEIEQLKQGIADVAGTAQYNEMKLLDGSASSSHVASGPNGDGLEINMANATLEALGIADYDVTKDFDMSVLDRALSSISSKRGSMGATSNRLDYTINYNAIASFDMTSSRSRLEDTDYATAISEKKKEDLLSQYRMMMQKKKMESADGIVKLLHT